MTNRQHIQTLNQLSYCERDTKGVQKHYLPQPLIMEGKVTFPFWYPHTGLQKDKLHRDFDVTDRLVVATIILQTYKLTNEAT